MARLLTAREIATEALREISAYSPRDQAPNSDDLSIALRKLDLRVAELSGQMACWWLLRDTYRIALTTTEDSYDLRASIADQETVTEPQFVLDAYLEEPGATSLTPLRILDRNEFYTTSAETGGPRVIYIDRASPPLMWIKGKAPAAGYYVRLTAFRHPNDHVAPGSPVGREHAGASGARTTDLPAYWHRWAILATAYDIGGGPVRKLPEAELTRRARDIELARQRLREHSGRERLRRSCVVPRDF